MIDSIIISGNWIPKSLSIHPQIPSSLTLEKALPFTLTSFHPNEHRHQHRRRRRRYLSIHLQRSNQTFPASVARIGGKHPDIANHALEWNSGLELIQNGIMFGMVGLLFGYKLLCQVEENYVGDLICVIHVLLGKNWDSNGLLIREIIVVCF